MKKLNAISRTALVFAIIMIGVGSHAYALTGLGIGAKLGQVTKYDNPSLKLSDAKFSDFTAYGVFAKFGTKSVDVEFGADWSKDKQARMIFGENVQVEAKNFAYHATVKYVFPFPVLRPFIGGGIAAHKATYEYSGPLGEFDEVTIKIPSDDTFFGFHGVVGAKLQLGVLPFQPFIEGKFSRVNSDPATNITVVSGGLIFSFL